ncbi:hypothetical protein HKD37_06G017427 [Glycine soja]
MDAKITLILHHGGRFTPRASDGKVEYIGGEFDVWEDISANYMNTFILCDLDLDFNHGLRSCTTDGDILYLVKDVLENDNEINIYFHHEVDPIPKEVPLMLDLKSSNEDDLDDVPISGHKEDVGGGEKGINVDVGGGEERDVGGGEEKDVGGDEEENVGNPDDEDDNDDDMWFTDFFCMRKKIEVEYETYGYHLEELKNPISSDDEDEDVHKVYPQYNESSRFGEMKLEVRMKFRTLAEFKSA